MLQGWYSPQRDFKGRVWEAQNPRPLTPINQYQSALLPHESLGSVEPELSLDEREFASLDKTNDGALSKAELAAGLAASGIHRDHIDEVFSLVDRDQDGQMDGNEFEFYGVGEALAKMRERDMDGDGVLSYDEAAQELASVGMTPKRIRTTLKQMDKNSDARITIAELTAYISGLRHAPVVKKKERNSHRMDLWRK